jgi:hypothetical protein
MLAPFTEYRLYNDFVICDFFGSKLFFRRESVSMRV